MVKNHVITVAGAKGGVGKTTTSINLGAALAEHGYSVVAVEMDLPMPNFVDFLDVDTTEGETLPEVLNDQAPIQEAIYETPNGLSVIPSAPDLERYEETDLDAFPDIIDELRWYFDVILIDTPAGLSDEAKTSLEVGDETIIVSTPRAASLQNANETIDLAHRHDATIRGFVLNKSGTGASPGMDAIADSLPVEVLGHVPEDDAVPHSQDSGRPVVVKSPNSGAAIAYRRLARLLVESDTDGTLDDDASRDDSPDASSNGDSQRSAESGRDVRARSDPAPGPERASDPDRVDTEGGTVDPSTDADETDSESDARGGEGSDEEANETGADHGDPDRSNRGDEGTSKTGQAEKDGSLLARLKSVFRSS